MRFRPRRGGAIVALGLFAQLTTGALAEEPAADGPSGRRQALYTAGAVAANALPVASAFAEPRCIQGYIACKAMLALFSVVAAGESLIMSGGADREQPRAIVTRGFSGDWVVTPRQVAEGAKPDLLPEAAPPKTEKKEGEFVPPPL